MSASGDNNRSVRFTKARIRTAFFELMQEKSVHKITVAEIVRKADISRASFYLHYLDIYDLLQKTEEEIINCILEEIAKFDESTYVVGEFPIAQKVFKVLDSHSDEITLLLGENGDVSFQPKFQTALKDYFKMQRFVMVRYPRSVELKTPLLLLSGVFGV